MQIKEEHPLEREDLFCFAFQTPHTHDKMCQGDHIGAVGQEDLCNIDIDVYVMKLDICQASPDSICFCGSRIYSQPQFWGSYNLMQV